MIFGPYEVLGHLSTGGMAEVVQAWDTRRQTTVALKRLLPKAVEHPELARMFVEEARIAANLDHPNIPRLLDCGDVGGCAFIAYELVDGVDLRRLFERAVSRGSTLPIPFLTAVLGGVAEALVYAHERRPAIVHRDVNPQNIMISYAGDVKLIDFGIAKADDSATRTDAGIIKGKFGYLSPEQLHGAPVDARSDLFSLGICLWELLTLRRLFAAPNEIVVLDMIKRFEPSAPSLERPDVPAELDRIVLKVLAKDPSERYGSARELTKELSVFVDKSGARATREEVARTTRDLFREQSSLEGLASEQAVRGVNAPSSRSVGRIMQQLQETRMSDDDKGGSDLDIFEGLGKKASAKGSGAPPPPPGSQSKVPAASPSADLNLKRTLLGIPGPASSPSQASAPASTPSTPARKPPSAPPAPPASGSMRAAQPASSPPVPASKPPQPPPPPGRGSLPNLAATVPAQGAPQASASSSTQKSAPPVPPAPSTKPTPVAAESSQPNGQKLDMDWDDEEMATHVFDKESRDKEKAAEAAASDSRPPERANMDDILSAPPRTTSAPPPIPAAGTPAPPPPAAPATLSGAFASLGQTNGAPPSASFRSGPPASQSVRAAPPPPPLSQNRPPSAPPAMTPPPPPPGQATTAPMHMPPRPPAAPPPSGAHPAHAQQVPSAPPPPQFSSAPPRPVTQPPMPQMPPVSRAMEATALVPRPQPPRTGLWIALLLGVCALAGIVAFFVSSRPGTLVVNVADTKGGVVSGLEIQVDGQKKCDSAPCIVKDVAAGVHEVKVTAPGYEPPAPRAITIEARGQASADFSLVPSKGAAVGTGFKVSGTQSAVKLTVDGKDVGALPQEMHDLDPGDHTLRFTAGDRYAPLDKTIHVAKDEIVDMGTVTLKVLKGKAMIQLGTPGAKVYLVAGTNRKEVPQFPIAIDFDPNEHWQLEAKKDGYDDLVQPISFDDGQAEKTIVVTLSPKGQAPKAVAVAPAPVAAQPAQPAQPKQPPSFVKPDQPAGEAAEKPTAKADPAPKKDAPAAAGGEAFLNINSLPASTVLLDGKPLGPTPRVHVSVSPGAHTILFVNAEQSLKKSITVNVGAGETKAAFAKLRD